MVEMKLELVPVPVKDVDAAKEFYIDKLGFNALGDAITKIYTWLNPVARVLGPDPAYPTHSSIEGAHGRSPHMTYGRQPGSWLPDVEDIRNKVRYNPSIAALLIINPGNPTGMVYPRQLLEELVAIAKEFNLFLIADEIYAKLAFDQENYTSIATVAGDVPTMVMRGLSKEVPWPGSRCGWVEFYNTHTDKQYERYAKAIEEAKMNEVCSTTLPQSVLPQILSDNRYPAHLHARREKYQSRAQKAAELFNDSEYFSLIEPKGAFYAPVTFSDSFINNPPHLKPANDSARQLLEEELANNGDSEIDKKFCLELLAATGICVVPLSAGFNSKDLGFRMTLLEEDFDKFETTVRTIIESTQG